MIRSKHAATRRPLLRAFAAWCGLIGAVWSPMPAEAAAGRDALAARVQAVRAALAQAEAHAELAARERPVDAVDAEDAPHAPHAAGRPWLNWGNWNNWNNWPNWGNWGNWLNR